jgi:2-alkenal reductase
MIKAFQQRISQVGAVLALFVVLFGVAACATTEEPQTTDTDTIVAQVMDRLASQPMQQPSTATINYSGQQLAANMALESQLIELYQQVNPSVVYIVTQLGAGTGFVYDANGHIVTNNHVISNARSLEVVFANGERRTAEVVGADADADLAVIQVTDLPDDVSPLPLADAGTIQVGQFVIAIGSPFGEQGSMSLGIVSGLGRSLPSQRALTTGSTYSLPEVIQTDAPINPGNSGGPLLNLEGEVIGVNAAIASASGTNSGVGFSIPVAAVARIVPALISDGEYNYPYLGAAFDDEVSLSDQSLYGLSQTQGAYVVSVTSGSPAAQAGLVAANPNTGQGGDLIVALDGQPINDFQDLNSYLVFHATVGQTVHVTVLRDGEQITLPLTLGERP